MAGLPEYSTGCSVRSIRGRDASASLKLGFAPKVRTLGSRVHPRQRCLGLIEARTRRWHSQRPGRRIRGRDASASLKQAGGRTRKPVLMGMHPRQRCLGLIEAAAAPAALAAARPCIRGRDASASLKLVIGHVVDQRGGAHPRQRCLGLIEAREPLGENRSAGKRHPRQRCLGLIEAPPTTAPTCPSRPASEAEMPRPH